MKIIRQNAITLRPANIRLVRKLKVRRVKRVTK